MSASGLSHPAGLGARLCLQLSSRTSTSLTFTSRRTFANTLPRCKQRRGATPPSTRPTKPRPPPSPSEFTAPPRSPPPSAAKARSHGSVVDQLLEHGDQVLLYRAPDNHRSFTLLSISTAALLTVGAYQTVKLYFRDETPDGSKPLHPFVRLLGVIPAVFLAFGGFVLFSAPARLIQSITLVAPHVAGVNARAQPVVRCVSTIPLPLMRAQTFDCSPGRIFARRTVRAVADDKGFRWTSVALADAPRFTASSGPGAAAAAAAPSPALRGFWPLLKLQVRRMCLRDGFYNIRFPEGGAWKVDLQGAEVLENGHPLAAMMTFEAGAQQGWVGRVMAAFGQGAAAGSAASARRGR